MRAAPVAVAGGLRDGGGSVNEGRTREFWAKTGRLSPRAVALWCLLLTVVIESFTCILRFAVGLEAQKHGAWTATFTFGYRDHHAYWGMLLLAVAAIAWRRHSPRNVLFVVGGALLLSDVIHHLLVLWPVTGSPEFFTRYPGY